jgi:ATP-dependent Clp protease ATP-binding subunit ClpC
VQVLRVLEIQPEQLTRALAAAPTSGGETTRRFSGPAANALELTATEAIGMQHNYIGCEHLLVALAMEPDGTAGTALRALGADARAVRRTVTAAVAGYAHLRAQAPAADPGAMLAATVRKELEPLIRRIERLEGAQTDDQEA